ncbi:MAG TPA: ATP-binding protein [Kofleriaceae bacterium]|nr:ATP-binding protein [Kofleriaceae bacterium]
MAGKLIDLHKRAEERISGGARSPHEIAGVAYQLELLQVELDVQSEDIERQRAEVEALRQTIERQRCDAEAARDRYRILWDGAPVGIVALRAGTWIVEGNATAWRMLGQAPKDRVPLARFLDEADADRLHIALGRSERATIEVRVRPAHGAAFQAVLAIEPVAGAATFRVAIVDTTGAHDGTDGLRRALAAAEAANLAKTEFLSSLSHELRTPLNAILGFAQLLECDHRRPLDERQLERVRHLLAGGEHMLELVNDVLDFARIEQGKIKINLEPIAIADVIANVVTNLIPMADGLKIAIAVIDPAPDLPAIVADRVRIAQILMNLGTNAIKYGRPDGHVTFRAASEGSMLRIAVSDDGIGIPEDKRDRIFTPFERAGQELGAVEGTGIGLAISKRLAELMQARIGFASEVGRGSEFWIDFPVDR